MPRSQSKSVAKPKAKNAGKAASDAKIVKSKATKSKTKPVGKAPLSPRPPVAKSAGVKAKAKLVPQEDADLKGYRPVTGEVIDSQPLKKTVEPSPREVSEIHETEDLEALGSDVPDLEVLELEVPEVELLDEDAEDSTSEDPGELTGDFTEQLGGLPLESGERGLVSADPIARYMAEIGRYRLLTREEEQKLAIRYRETGDPKAAEALVTANLRFVVKVAAEYTKFGAKLIDLVQEGNVGLMHAVKEFNPYKGVKLITYAVWWIRGYIQEFLMRQYSMVRIGTTATQRKLFYQLQKERDKLERMGLEQGIAQISGKLGISPEEVQDMHSRLSGRDVSLDQPVGAEGSSRLIDLQSQADPSQLDEELGTREELKMLTDKISELRPSLNERELFLLDARLLSDDPLTLQEIGDKYGTTREAVRQMEVRVMDKIRKALTRD